MTTTRRSVLMYTKKFEPLPSTHRLMIMQEKSVRCDGAVIKRIIY